MPDGLLFRDAAAKAKANKTPEEWRRYEYGLAVVEIKAVEPTPGPALGPKGEETAPSAKCCVICAGWKT